MLDANLVERLVITIPNSLEIVTGLALNIVDSFGGISILKKHKKMEVGDVLVEKTTRTVFYLVTRDRTNKSSLDNLANYFTKLKEICSHKNIIILAFPKHGMGLDKLCWTDVENLIKKTFSEEIKCTIYTNAIAIQENTSDLDINSK